MRAGARHFIHAAVPLSPATERRSCAFSRSPEPATRVHEPMEPSAATPKRRLSASAAEVYPKARRHSGHVAQGLSTRARRARRSISTALLPAGAADEEASHVVPRAAAAVLSESPPPSPRAEYTEAPPSPRPAPTRRLRVPDRRKESPLRADGYEPAGFEDEPRDMAERLGWRPTSYYGAGRPSPSRPAEPPPAERPARARGPPRTRRLRRASASARWASARGALVRPARAPARRQRRRGRAPAPRRYTPPSAPSRPPGAASSPTLGRATRPAEPRRTAPVGEVLQDEMSLRRDGPYRDERCQYAHSRDELRCAARRSSARRPARPRRPWLGVRPPEYDTAPQAPPPRRPNDARPRPRPTTTFAWRDIMARRRRRLRRSASTSWRGTAPSRPRANASSPTRRASSASGPSASSGPSRRPRPPSSIYRRPRRRRRLRNVEETPCGAGHAAPLDVDVPGRAGPPGRDPNGTTPFVAAADGRAAQCGLTDGECGPVSSVFIARARPATA